jgi:hypothetical protein
MLCCCTCRKLVTCVGRCFAHAKIVASGGTITPALRPPTDGCTTVHCFCKEFLLPPGDYQNPFDSTHSTGIRCDFRQEGWYGGMIRCTGGYFDPYKRDCVDATAATTAAMLKIPVRREYRACTATPPYMHALPLRLHHQLFLLALLHATGHVGHSGTQLRPRAGGPWSGAPNYVADSRGVSWEYAAVMQLWCATMQLWCSTNI